MRGEKVLTERAGESLRLEAGAGKLVITGRSGIDYIRVDATLCASDQERLDAPNVSLDGGTLDTDYPRNGASGWFARNRYARIDLVVQVPAGTNLRVDDSSGSIEITGVGDVDLRDGSGSMRLSSVASVVVEDGAGSLRIDDVAGNVTVEDGSGSLRIGSVGGDVVISDGSGSIEVGAVEGTVRIDGGGIWRFRVCDCEPLKFVFAPARCAPFQTVLKVRLHAEPSSLSCSPAPSVGGSEEVGGPRAGSAMQRMERSGVGCGPGDAPRM